MSADRIIIGGTDVTECIAAIAAAAPPLTQDQMDRLRSVFAPARARLVASRIADEQHDADVRPLVKPTRTRRRPMAA